MFANVWLVNPQHKPPVSCMKVGELKFLPILECKAYNAVSEAANTTINKDNTHHQKRTP